jgi:hypothetical protein
MNIEETDVGEVFTSIVRLLGTKAGSDGRPDKILCETDKGIKINLQYFSKQYVHIVFA